MTAPTTGPVAGSGEIAAPILSERHGPVAILTLNRPHKLNALDATLIEGMQSALSAAEVDDGVRAIVITGAGRAFSAGADITGFQPAIAGGVDTAHRDFVRPGQDLARRIESFRKPIIAAVNGLAYGGGCEILEAMHMAVASEAATFAKAEIDIGIIPVFGGTQRLPRHVGRKQAYEMILTGRPIDAAEALRRGLVNRVVPAGEEIGEALALAREVSAKSSVAVAAAMFAIARGLNASIDEGLLIEAAAFERVVESTEARNGVARFLAGRGDGRP